MLVAAMHVSKITPAPQADVKPVRDARRQVTLEAYALLEDGSTFGVTVVDLSYDGCKVESAVALEIGAKIKLSVVGLGALDARVRWSSEGFAGLSFKPDTVVEADLRPRTCDRIALTADLALRRAGRQHYRANVFDLSPSGCKVEFVEKPKVGERLWAKFDGLEALEAEVCWVEGFHGGVRFITPIYPAVFDLLLASLSRR